MKMILNLFYLFWFIREVKFILFWLYLWQLKEYHIGRFVDHFRTQQGKRIIEDKLALLKLVLLFIILIRGFGLSENQYIFLTLLAVYAVESAKFFIDIILNKLKRPVFTKKTLFLILTGLSFAFWYWWVFSLGQRFLFWILLFDILTPLLTSGIVIIFQPLTFFLRKRIIERAREKMSNFDDLLVIGITGSYGKTSTKEFLSTILSDKFKVLKTKEHQNSEVGISRSVLEDLNNEHEIFVVEMGAYNKGGIKMVADIVKPKIGILTGINEQHLATFGSLADIIKAKYELIEALPADGTAVFNGNNRYCLDLYHKTDKPKKIVYTTADNKGDVWAEDIVVERGSVSFKVSNKNGESAHIRINLLGAYNIENLLLAICCAHHLGMSFKEISKACSKISEGQGGIKLLKGVKGTDLLDSTYSSNPSGVLSHLEYLKIWDRGRKVVVMPCLIELAGSSAENHRKIGEKIGDICDLAIITKKSCFCDIKNGVSSRTRVIYLNSSEQIVEKVSGFIKKGDVILLEGRLPKELIKGFTQD